MTIISKGVFNTASFVARKIGRRSGLDFTIQLGKEAGRTLGVKQVMTTSIGQLAKLEVGGKAIGRIGAFKLLGQAYGQIFIKGIKGLIAVPGRILRNTPGIKKLFKNAAQAADDATGGSPKMLTAGKLNQSA